MPAEEACVPPNDITDSLNALLENDFLKACGVIYCIKNIFKKKVTKQIKTCWFNLSIKMWKNKVAKSKSESTMQLVKD